MKVNPFTVIFSILTLLQVPAVLAGPSFQNKLHDASLKRHTHHNPRVAHAHAPVSIDVDSSRNDSSIEERRLDTLSKRFSASRFSFFHAGLAACGGQNTDGDFIVAINSMQYGNGEHCFETITISYAGKTAQAQIVDMCPDCPYGGLDFSPGLFNFFASEDTGIIYGDWDFGLGAAPPPQTISEPPPPVTTSPPPPPEPSPTPTPSPSTTEESSLSFGSPSQSQSSTSRSARPSTTPGEGPAPMGMIGQFNLAFMQLAGLASAASVASPA